MRKSLMITVAAALLVGGVASASAATSTVQNAARNEPLLVKVDAQGKVVSMLPAYPLTASAEKALRSTLNGMIKKPAVDKDGHAVPSQFLMDMTMQVQPGAAGNNNVQFAVASIKAIPNGQWRWFHTSDGKATLINGSRPIFRTWPNRGAGSPYNSLPNHTPPAQTVANSFPTTQHGA